MGVDLSGRQSPGLLVAENLMGGGVGVSNLAVITSVLQRYADSGSDSCPLKPQACNSGLGSNARGKLFLK